MTCFSNLKINFTHSTLQLTTLEIVTFCYKAYSLFYLLHMSTIHLVDRQLFPLIVHVYIIQVYNIIYKLLSMKYTRSLY